MKSFPLFFFLLLGNYFSYAQENIQPAKDLPVKDTVLKTDIARDINAHLPIREISVIDKFKEAITKDQNLAHFLSSIDFIQCGDIIIVYGVVNNPKAKNDIGAKLKHVDPSIQVENKIIVR